LCFYSQISIFSCYYSSNNKLSTILYSLKMVDLCQCSTIVGKLSCGVAWYSVIVNPSSYILLLCIYAALQSIFLYVICTADVAAPTGTQRKCIIWNTQSRHWVKRNSTQHTPGITGIHMFTYLVAIVAIQKCCIDYYIAILYIIRWQMFICHVTILLINTIDSECNREIATTSIL